VGTMQRSSVKNVSQACVIFTFLKECPDMGSSILVQPKLCLIYFWQVFFYIFRYFGFLICVSVFGISFIVSFVGQITVHAIPFGKRRKGVKRWKEDKWLLEVEKKRNGLNIPAK
jgi:hypothetical protein